MYTTIALSPNTARSSALQQGGEYVGGDGQQRMMMRFMRRKRRGLLLVIQLEAGCKVQTSAEETKRNFAERNPEEGPNLKWVRLILGFSSHVDVCSAPSEESVIRDTVCPHVTQQHSSHHSVTPRDCPFVMDTRFQPVPSPFASGISRDFRYHT
jgi:hypothetical protein